MLALLVVVFATAAAAAAATAAAAGTAAAGAPGENGCEGFGSNAVARENCLYRHEGSPASEWDVNGSGDHEIVGFADSMSYAPGETVQLRVRSVSDKYRVDMYRLGWYNGSGARRVATVRPFVPLPQEQPECLSEADTQLYDCGTWHPSVRWEVPQNATAGVYIARLVREDTLEARPVGAGWRSDYSQHGKDPKFSRPGPDLLEVDEHELPHAYGTQKKRGDGPDLRNALKEPRASHVYFVVRSLDSRAAVVFQTADTTWQAYNRFGGTSTYGSYVAGKPRERSLVGSYNRPFVNRDYRGINIIFGAEYPAIRFLERNGVDVTYWSSLDTHLHGARLGSQHRVFLSVGHDEYWTAQQRRHVEAARDAGVNLMFLSGNEVFWKVRWEASKLADADGQAAPMRTMVCYKETQEHVKRDPRPDMWTGTFRDSRAINPEGGDPENSLTGLLFTVNAWRNDPLIVPRRFSRLPLWRGTEVAALAAQPAFLQADQVTYPGNQPILAVGAERPVLEPWAVLKQGVLGHEWDEDVDNGHRPPGLVRMSETHVDNVAYIQDSGSQYDTSSGTHRLVVYRAEPPTAETEAAAAPGSESCEAAHGRALVFGAGTVQWSWGLDPFHDNEAGLIAADQNAYDTRVGWDLRGPDRAVQQATINVLAWMGVQPATLERGLESGEPLDVAEDERLLASASCTVAPDVKSARVKIGVTGLEPEQTVAAVEVSRDGKRWHPVEPDMALYAQRWAEGAEAEADPSSGRFWSYDPAAPRMSGGDGGGVEGPWFCRFVSPGVVLSRPFGPF